MRVLDESLWQAQRAELADGTEVDRRFLEFVESWAEAIEQIVDYAADLGEQVADDFYATALRQTLERTESTLGKLSVSFLAQVMAVIIIYWEHGEQLARGLNPIELRLVQEALATKIASQAQEAAHPDEAAAT